MKGMGNQGDTEVHTSGVIEKTGSVVLAKGRHALTVEFSNDGGGGWIDAFYKGPGIPKQLIPADKLFKKSNG